MMQQRKKVSTGDFRFGEAILEGVIVREDPVRKVGRNGTAWLKASLLVDLYDSRQRAERERPVFIRVLVFERSAPKAYSVLEACNKRDKVSVAGQLRIHNYESRDGDIRESFELIADYVVRNDRFETLANLVAQEHGSSEPALRHQDRASAGGEDRYGAVSDDDVPF